VPASLRRIAPVFVGAIIASISNINGPIGPTRSSVSDVGGALVPTTTVSLPQAAAASGPPAVSDTQLAYVLPVSPASATTKTSSSARIFVRSLRSTSTGLTVGPPHPICTITGPSGLVVTLWSAAGEWVGYSASHADRTAPWSLAMCHVLTGRHVVLDTSAGEKVSSLPITARSDGHTVVWVSSTLLGDHHQETTVIRTYDLASSRRRVLAQGGSPSTFAYGDPSVSGQRVLFEKSSIAGDGSVQLLLADVDTGRIRPISRPQPDIAGASLSGNIVTWGIKAPGADWSNGAIGIGVYNVRTRARTQFNEHPITIQQAVAGHDVVFVTGEATLGQLTTLWLYDARTGRRVRLVQPHPPQSYGVGNVISIGGHAIAYLGATPGQQAPTHVPVVILLLP